MHTLVHTDSRESSLAPVLIIQRAYFLDAIPMMVLATSGTFSHPPTIFLIANSTVRGAAHHAEAVKKAGAVEMAYTAVEPSSAGLC